MRVDSDNAAQKAQIAELKRLQESVSTGNKITNDFVSTEKVNLQSFQADIVKANLQKLFDANNSTTNSTATSAPKPPVDYFEIDKKADELIKNHTEDGFLFFGDSLDTDGLGKDLADIAKKDSTPARALTDNVLDKISDSDRSKVANNLVKSMRPEELRDAAKTADGRKMLEQLKGYLASGSDDEKKSATRIDTAIKTADLENTAEFKKLSPEAQNEIRAQIANNDTNRDAFDNIINVAQSKGFNAASKDTQVAALRVVGNHPEDKIFSETLVKTLENSKFQALAQADQSKVVSDLDRFANTESYKGKDGWLFGIGGRSVSDEDKRILLEKVGEVSIFSAENPGDKIIRNTLEHIVSDDIRLDLYSKDPEVRNGITYYEYGFADDDSIHLNKKTIGTDFDQFVETLAHEANHFINDRSVDSKAGTPDRFLDEYRAFIAGYEGAGHNLSGADLQGVLDNLAHSKDSAYPHLRKLYEDNEAFRKVVDKAYEDAGKGVLIDADQMERRLVAAGFDSEYLQKTGNMDNY